jgi:hypothetical protein
METESPTAVLSSVVPFPFVNPAQANARYVGPELTLELSRFSVSYCAPAA